MSHSDSHTEPIEMEKASFSWDGDRPTLQDITLTVPEGSLVAIVGTVGSGVIICTLLFIYICT